MRATVESIAEYKPVNTHAGHLVGPNNPPGWRDLVQTGRRRMSLTGASAVAVATGTKTVGHGVRAARIECELKEEDDGTLGGTPSRKVIRGNRAGSAVSEEEDLGAYLGISGPTGDSSSARGQKRRLRTGVTERLFPRRCSSLREVPHLKVNSLGDIHEFQCRRMRAVRAQTGINASQKAATHPILGLEYLRSLDHEAVLPLKQVARRPQAEALSGTSDVNEPTRRASGVKRVFRKTGGRDRQD